MQTMKKYCGDYRYPDKLQLQLGNSFILVMFDKQVPYSLFLIYPYNVINRYNIVTATIPIHLTIKNDVRGHAVSIRDYLIRLKVQ